MSSAHSGVKHGLRKSKVLGIDPPTAEPLSSLCWGRSGPSIGDGFLAPSRLRSIHCQAGLTNLGPQTLREGLLLRPSFGNVCYMASLSDHYRSHLHGEAEKETVWRHGAPPGYDLVNEVFESGRTQEWKKGSLEEAVQNLVKTWEMELSHKTRLGDFKSIDFDKFSFSVNGGPPLSAEELLKTGSYNALLASVEHPCYKASSHTFESSHEVFLEAFPGGFAWEVLQVYSGPPTVVCKWRHWGTNAKTNQVVEMIGMAVAEVNEQLKIEKLEVYYDPAQFLDKLFGPRKDLAV